MKKNEFIKIVKEAYTSIKAEEERKAKINELMLDRIITEETAKFLTDLKAGINKPK